MAKQHFNTLDALRFFAFLKVFLLHLPLVAGFPVYAFLKSGGGIGVSFFFVLSGFLISYILIKEKQQTAHIDGRRFFWRRALRIWPLYFAGVILAYAGLFVMHRIDAGAVQNGYTPQWFFSFTFTENYAMIWHNDLPDGAPLAVFWSLCIEEHFYLLWLLLFSILPLKRISSCLAGLWLFAIILRISLAATGYGERIIGKELFTSLDYFAAGGLLAASLRLDTYKADSLFSAFSKTAQWLCVVLVIVYVSTQHLLKPYTAWLVLEPLVSSVLFCLLIGILVHSKKLIIGDRNILSRLGHISYGLYVYHTLVIVILLKVFSMLDFSLEKGVFLALFALAAFLLSVLSALVSYRFIEKPFLAYREKRLAYNK